MKEGLRRQQKEPRKEETLGATEAPGTAREERCLCAKEKVRMLSQAERQGQHNIKSSGTTTQDARTFEGISKPETG